MGCKDRIIIASRGSKLALHQTGMMADLLRELNPGVEFEIKVIKTEADQKADAPLAEISGEGIFVKELERSLRDKESDLAIHSLKDMPAAVNPGLALAAIPKREDPRDVLVSASGKGFADLPSGSRLGSSSPRRMVQLKDWRSDIELKAVRGNIDTRLRKAASGEFDGVVLAAAALRRLGWDDRITEYFPVDRCLPAPGQGALALEVREDDARVIELCSALNDFSAERSVTAERAFLRALGGGCRAPIAALGTVDGNEITLDGLAASEDGEKILRAHMRGAAASAEAIGLELAGKLLNMGAKEFMPAGRSPGA